MKWIYWSEYKSGPLPVNIRSASTRLINKGSHPCTLFAYQLHLAITIKDSRWCVVNTHLLHSSCALLTLGPGFAILHVITTRSALLCLTSPPTLDIPLQRWVSMSASPLTLKRCAYAVGSIFVFQMKELRHWVVKWATQGHTVNLEYSWDPGRGVMVPGRG